MLFSGDGYLAPSTSSLLRNDQAAFTRTGPLVPPQAECAWGDYDGDGDLDLFVARESSDIPAAHVWINDGQGNLSPLDVGLPSSSGGPFAWGDYDNDGDLDLVINGQLWRNDTPIHPATPDPPEALRALALGNRANFSWSPPGQAIPAQPLSYNLRVGSSPGTADILSPHSGLTTGHRHVPALGNARYARSTYLNLPVGTYYWSVQAINGALVGGGWAPERVLTIAQDSDADGLPDAWETAHGLNSSSSHDAALDSDGDGHSNAAEFVAGTDPCDPGSALSLSVDLGDGSAIRALFPTAAGKTYQVQKSVVSPAGAWFPVLEHIAGTGTTITLNLPENAEPTAFYRVVLE